MAPTQRERIPTTGDSFICEVGDMGHATVLTHVEPNWERVDAGDDPEIGERIALIVVGPCDGRDYIIDIVERKLCTLILHRLHHRRVAAIGLHHEFQIRAATSLFGNNRSHGVPDRSGWRCRDRGDVC